MTNTINFTKQALDALSVTELQYDVKDRKTPGLIVRINPGGKKTFMFFRRVNGKLLRVKIGYTHDISIEQARKKAISLNSQIISGVNPNEILRGKRKELTFQQLFDKYYLEHALVHTKWPGANKATLEFHLPAKFWAKKVGDITKQQLRDIHLKQGESRGKQQANRVLNIISAVYNFGIREDLYNGTNPTMGIKRFKSRSRDRFLSAEELRKFFLALESEEQLYRDFFMLSVFIGARKNNMLKMRYSHIDFDLKRWRLTEDESKNNDVNIYMLSDHALDILKRRWHENKCQPVPSEFVFPGGGIDGHLKDPKRSFTRIKQRMGVTDIWIHDLRRTLASYMAINNTSLPIIGRALNHKSQVSTAIYARLSGDPVREAVNSATQLMINKIRKPDMSFTTKMGYQMGIKYYCRL
ncbi:MAG: site-specific integrase [Flavipsychrobacter sp.]